jgi:hypothetical protein
MNRDLLDKGFHFFMLFYMEQPALKRIGVAKAGDKWYTWQTDGNMTAESTGEEGFLSE